MAGRRPNFTPRPWTDEDVGNLLQKVYDKVPQDQIAQDLGRTVSAVEGKLRLIREGAIRQIGGQTEGRYERPEPVETNCQQHLERIARANNGMGFPVLPIARFRRAV